MDRVPSRRPEPPGRVPAYPTGMNTYSPDTDTDVLIAAHALHYGAVIVSANLERFQATGVSVENWDEPLVKS